QSFAACAQIDDPGFVALRRDDACLDCYVGPRASDRFLDQPGLRPCEFAATRAEDNFLDHRCNLVPGSLQGKFWRSAVCFVRRCRTPKALRAKWMSCRRRYSPDARNESWPSEEWLPACDTRLIPREIESTKSVTCSAIMASAAVTCWRLSARDCSATDRNESMS